jgi:hypothetical protein
MLAKFCVRNYEFYLHTSQQMPKLATLSAPGGTNMQFYGTLGQYFHGLHCIAISHLHDESGIINKLTEIR